MTKADLVVRVHEAIGPGVTKKDCAALVDGFLNAIKQAMVDGENIEIRGFGSFSINHRPPRMGRNPRSGESVAIPSKRVPHFKPGKALREAVDKRTEELGQDPK